MSKRILVVDDDEAICETTRYILEDKGYDVETTHGAVGRYLQTYKPDLIILDYRLPEKNGDQIVKEIRDKKSTTIPVIVISSDGSVLKSVYNAGANAFIEKPFDFGKLIEIIKQF